jgi:Na+/glutamate symporter
MIFGITVAMIAQGIIIGIIAGGAQAVGSWLVVRTVLKKIDERDKQISETVQELHLSEAQKNEFAKRLAESSTEYVRDYGKTLKSAFLWWKEK